MLLQSIVMEDPGLPLKPIIPGGAGGAMVPPHFSRSNSTKRGRLCPPNDIILRYWHPWSGSSDDLPTALQLVYAKKTLNAGSYRQQGLLIS